METGFKQLQLACGSVITMVANDTSPQVQPTDRGLVKRLWHSHFGILLKLLNIQLQAIVSSRRKVQMNVEG